MEEKSNLQKKKREFGRAIFFNQKNQFYLKNFFNEKNKSVWMSHEDAVVKLPKNFKIIASTKNSKFTIIENTKNKNLWSSISS